MEDQQRVALFLCTHNAARSQMAAALLRRYAADRFEAHSTGLEPSGVHPLAIEVMQEIGVSPGSDRDQPHSVREGKTKTMSDRKVSSRDKAVAEIFGTFSLVFAGTGAIIINDASGGAVTHVGVALTFGLVVMAMIYAVGDVSGAHLNPAVTFGFWLSKRLPTSALPLYLGSQFAGAMAASLLLRFMFRDHPTLGATIPVGPDSRSFLLEVVLTAILMFVILAVSTGPKEKGLMAGIAVGGVIAFEAMFAGPISGASMNPFRSLAPAVVSGHFESLWVYLTAPLVGAVIGLVCFRGTQSSRRHTVEPVATVRDEPSHDR